MLHFCENLALILVVVLSQARAAKAEAPLSLAPDVTMQQLTDHIWMHTSTQRQPGGDVIPSNGLVVETDHGSILIDTAWTDDQTAHILTWAGNVRHQPVHLAIVTHAHNDRMGGVSLLLSRGIPVSGLKETQEIALARKVPGPNKILDLTVGHATEIEGIEFFFPGPGHAADNLIAWFPQQKLLFGGCLVKSKDASSLGFVGDANIPHWPVALKSLKDRFPSATTIVPGHGPPGGAELLDHTLSLLARTAPATQPSEPELLH